MGLRYSLLPCESKGTEFIRTPWFDGDEIDMRLSQTGGCFIGYPIYQ